MKTLITLITCKEVAHVLSEYQLPVECRINCLFHYQIKNKKNVEIIFIVERLTDSFRVITRLSYYNNYD